MASIVSISTDAVPQPQRYAFWRESVALPLSGMSIDCPREKRREFWGRIRASRIPGAAAQDIERTGSGALAQRSARDIARHPSRNLLICTAPNVRSWFHPHGGDEFIAEPGSIVVGRAEAARAAILSLSRVGASRPVKRSDPDFASGATRATGMSGTPGRSHPPGARRGQNLKRLQYEDDDDRK